MKQRTPRINPLASRGRTSSSLGQFLFVFISQIFCIFLYSSGEVIAEKILGQRYTHFCSGRLAKAAILIGASSAIKFISFKSFRIEYNPAQPESTGGNYPHRAKNLPFQKVDTSRLSFPNENLIPIPALKFAKGILFARMLDMDLKTRHFNILWFRSNLLDFLLKLF
jgi:hypothetical protein